MNKPTRFYSSRQEKGIAKAFNGKPVNNSGAGKFKKGDVEIGDLFLIEAKLRYLPVNLLLFSRNGWIRLERRLFKWVNLIVH